MNTPPSATARVHRLLGDLLRGERPLPALFQTVGAQGLILVANLLTGVLAARLLGAEGRGEYAALALWPQLLAMLAVAGWSTAAVYRMRARPASASGTAAAALVGAWLGTVVCVAAGLLLLPIMLRRYDSGLIAFGQLTLFAAFANATHMMVKQTLIGRGAYARANFTNVLPQVLYLPALLLLIPLDAMDARGAVLALLGSGVLALLALLPAWWRRARPRFSQARSELGPLSGYAARAWAGELVVALCANADRLVLVPLLRPVELGLYAVAYSFSRLVQIAQPAIVSVFFSQLSGRALADAQRLHDHALRILIVVLAAGCALLWLVGETLLTFTFGAEFGAANGIFRLLCIEAAFGVLAQLGMQLYLSADRPGFVSALQSATLALSLVALLAVVPAHGAAGAAAALAAVAAVRWVALLLALPAVLGLKRPALLARAEDFRFITRRMQ